MGYVSAYHMFAKDFHSANATEQERRLQVILTLSSNKPISSRKIMLVGRFFLEHLLLCKTIPSNSIASFATWPPKCILVVKCFRVRLVQVGCRIFFKKITSKREKASRDKLALWFPRCQSLILHLFHTIAYLKVTQIGDDLVIHWHLYAQFFS